MLKIILFGTLKISGPLGEANFSRRQSLVVLIILALSRAAVTRDKLAFFLWSDASQSLARQRLRRVLSQLSGILEKIGAADVLKVQLETVMLDEPNCEVDVWQFTHLAHLAARVYGKTAITLGEQCLALYNGLPFNYLNLNNAPEFENWLVSEQSHLTNLYEETLFNLATAYSDNGNANQAIKIARKLLAINPLYEKTHCLLMTLYAMQGQRCAALKQYEECARLLYEELGVKPLPKTTELYESLKAPTTPVIPPRWLTYDCLDVPHLGRSDKVKQLQQVLTAGLAGSSVIACVHGPAGIGKTRLIREAVERFSVNVCVGSGINQGKFVPFSSITNAIRPFLTQTLSNYPSRTLNISDHWLSEASRILPEIRLYQPNLCLPLELEREQVQPRLFEALTQLVIALAQVNGGAILVLDALDESEPCSLAWLSNLVRHIQGVPLGIVVAYRTPINDPTLSEWATYIEHIPAQRSIALSPLSQENIVELLNHMDVPAVHHRHLLEYCWERAGGNPLFILETLRELLQSNPRLTTIHNSPVPATVRQIIQARIDTLNEETRIILETCAALHPNICVPHIRQVSGRAEIEVVRALDLLINCGFLVVSEEGEVSFANSYMAETTYSHIGPMRKAMLGQQASQALQVHVST